MIKAVIFDLDGTLLNTLEDLKDSTNFALAEFNYPSRNLEEIRCFVGNGVKKLIERAIPGGSDNKDFEKCLSVFKEHYSQNMYNHTAPYNSILEILKELKQNKFKIAVVSNKFDSAVKELCKKYFCDFIDVSIGQSDNVPKKPAPDGVFKAIEELGVEPVECIYVGDSEVDVQTSKNAHLPCIGVTWGFRSKDVLQKEGCEYIIDKPCDIINLIKEL